MAQNRLFQRPVFSWRLVEVKDACLAFYRDLSFHLPLEDLKDYYGSNIAFYFAFVAYFARGLVPMAGLGILALFLSFARSFVLDLLGFKAVSGFWLMRIIL